MPVSSSKMLKLNNPRRSSHIYATFDALWMGLAHGITLVRLEYAQMTWAKRNSQSSGNGPTCRPNPLQQKAVCLHCSGAVLRTSWISYWMGDRSTVSPDYRSCSDQKRISDDCIRLSKATTPLRRNSVATCFNNSWWPGFVAHLTAFQLIVHSRELMKPHFLWRQNNAYILVAVSQTLQRNWKARATPGNDRFATDSLKMFKCACDWRLSVLTAKNSEFQFQVLFKVDAACRFCSCAIAHHVRRCRRSSVWSAGPAWVYSGWRGWRSPLRGLFHFSWHTPSMQIVDDCRYISG